MMNRLVAIALTTTTTLTAAHSASAVTIFQAIITHDQEVSNPPIPNEGSSGIGIFELNDAMTALSYDVTLIGLDLDGNQTPGNVNDDVTRTHFHVAPAGSNGGIVFGQIDASPTLRNDLDDLVVNPATGRITGVWDNAEGNGTTLGAQLANLLAGNLYFNVHTSDHGGGEIRGQVVIIPEPSTVALLACGLIGMARTGAHRRRRG
jgi:serralysin